MLKRCCILLASCAREGRWLTPALPTHTCRAQATAAAPSTRHQHPPSSTSQRTLGTAQHIVRDLPFLMPTLRSGTRTAHWEKQYRYVGGGPCLPVIELAFRGPHAVPCRHTTSSCCGAAEAVRFSGEHYAVDPWPMAPSSPKGSVEEGMLHGTAWTCATTLAP